MNKTAAQRRKRTEAQGGWVGVREGVYILCNVIFIWRRCGATAPPLSMNAEARVGQSKNAVKATVVVGIADAEDVVCRVDNVVDVA